jgi:hypothetical protein
MSKKPKKATVAKTVTTVAPKRQYAIINGVVMTIKDAQDYDRDKSYSQD